ncbi:MAG: hypothetical protein Unbinned7865contig1001_56 [Prokaryotic dsDNA virus sp.]|nr:MAG: hypothetical protein Unbinned7865contig1001_56 [Prokaryotic dsDNA virus sp.]
MSDLIHIKREWRKTEFVWGSADCIMSVCDYILDQTGIDPAAPWRGTYSDEAGAQAICDRYGGALGLFRSGMALAGLNTGARAAGRPVIADMMGKEIAGIDTGKRVMMRMDGRGVVEWPAEVLEAWEI